MKLWRDWLPTARAIDDARARGLQIGGTFEFISSVLGRKVTTNEGLTANELIAVREAVRKLEREAGHE